MKKATCLFLLLFIGCPLTSVAQQIEKDPTMATLVFYRDGQFFGSGVNFNVFVNGEKICKLSNNKYLVYKVKPGKTEIGTGTAGLNLAKKQGLALDTEAGGIYYVQCDMKQSLVANRLELTEVTKSTAEKKMSGLSPDNCMAAVKDEPTDSSGGRIGAKN